MRSRALDAVGEAAGWFTGWTLAPAVGMLTRLRGTRLFHAEGAAYHAVVAPDARLLPPPGRRLAASLAGPALVRLSAAFWRGREWPDILGLGLRFYGATDAGLEAPGVQDLLLATARSLLGLPLGLAHTDPHDFLGNEYGADGFEAEGLGPVRVRGLFARRSPQGPDRGARLAAAVERGHARLDLELRLEGSREWLRLVDVELRGAAELDEGALRFSPFRAEAGLRPAGFWQAMRVGPYRVAQSARGTGVPAEEATPARARRHPRALLPRRLRRAAARAPFRRGPRG